MTGYSMRAVLSVVVLSAIACGGMAVAEDMDGQVMSQLLIGGTGGHPVRFIATYEPESIPGIPAEGEEIMESGNSPAHLE